MTYHNPIPADLASEWGIHPVAQDWLPEEFRRDYTRSEKLRMAMDAQPTLVTTPSAAVPMMMTTYLDPETVRILQTPNKGAEIIGERKLGSGWLTQTAMFTVLENTGEVTSYGDYNETGKADVNYQFPQRQSFAFQTFVEVGEKEAEIAGLAKLNLFAEKKNSAAIVINKFFDLSYHFGVGGLQNYGLLNDPSLPAALTPGTKAAGGTKWVNNGIVVASPNEIMLDVQSLIYALITSSPGYIQPDDAFTLVGPPMLTLALTSTNSFGLTAMDMLKKTFPNLKIVTSPRYATTAGNVIQIWADRYDGNDIGFCGFGEKMREHAVIQESSASKQKVSALTFGAIIKYPLGVAQMLGV